MAPDFRYEKRLWKRGYRIVAGADEVGRGAWAGSVVAGAVAFAPNSKFQILNFEIRIDDSKKLSPKQRERAEKWIKKNALCWGLGQASVSEINKYSMGKASKMAFRRAVTNCNWNLVSSIWNLGKEKKKASPKIQNSRFKIQYLLIDAFYLPYTVGLPVGRKKRRVTRTHPVRDARGARQLAIINGDEKCFSIAAASILAKVYRDKLMRKLSHKYPSYKWAKNKGYGTGEHQDAIKKYGATKLHRKAFINNVNKD